MGQMSKPRRQTVGAARPIAYTSIASPLGEVWLAATGQGICRLCLGASEAEWLETIEGEFGSALQREADRFADACQQLTEYLEGHRHSFDLPLDLSRGSCFQRRVWASTRRIPYGQARSYAQIAHDVGAPRAARAVGQALGANPVPIIVPCHRVVRADGSLGGYGAGPGLKEALLSLEGYL